MEPAVLILYHNPSVSDFFKQNSDVKYKNCVGIIAYSYI